MRRNFDASHVHTECVWNVEVRLVCVDFCLGFMDTNEDMEMHMFTDFVMSSRKLCCAQAIVPICLEAQLPIFYPTISNASDKIIKKAEERGGSGNAVAECPVCSEVISKPMLQYDVYEPSRIFCNPLKQLSKILKQGTLACVSWI